MNKVCKAHGELTPDKLTKRRKCKRCVCDKSNEYRARNPDKVKESKRNTYLKSKNNKVDYNCKHHGYITKENMTAGGFCLLCHRDVSVTGYYKNRDKYLEYAKTRRDKLRENYRKRAELKRIEKTKHWKPDTIKVCKVCQRELNINEIYINYLGLKQCRYCLKVRALSYRERTTRWIREKCQNNAEFRKECNARTRKWRKNNKDKVAENKKRNLKKYVDNMSDTYIKKLLMENNFDRDLITPEIINMKREILKLKRKIRS